MSTEAHSFITIPLETFHEPQASILQCLKEPSCAKTVKDPCTQGQTFRNHHPKKIIRSKQVSYIRWRNIPPKWYQIFKKKGWKGLVGHPCDRVRPYKFFVPFYYIWFLSFFIYPLSFYFYFWQQTTFWCLFLWENVAVSFVDRCLVLKFGGLPGLFTPWIFILFW
jgi:hypothetical protein